MSKLTGKELRVEIDLLVAAMGKVQTKINELSAQLIVVTKEEMKRR